MHNEHAATETTVDYCSSLLSILRS